MCPGRPKSLGLLFGLAKALMVIARSCIDTPVVQPSSKSMVTVNGVPSIEVLSSTCMFNSSSWQRSAVMGAHSTPRPSRSIKLTFSSVIFSAAMIKSPSFSRSSSSTTMTNSPRCSCSTASSMVFSFISSMLFIFLFIIFIRLCCIPSHGCIHH